MKRRIFIRASYRLLQPRQNIIMMIAVTVVVHTALLRKQLCGFHRHRIALARKTAKLYRIRRLSHIAAAAVSNMAYNAFLKRELRVHLLAHKPESTFHRRKYILRRHLLEFKHGTA